MPGNIITVNGTSEFYVGDSDMPILLTILSGAAVAENEEAKRIISDYKQSKNTIDPFSEIYKYLSFSC